MIRSRRDVNAEAAVRLRQYIGEELGLSLREFCEIVQINECTLRYFFGNSTTTARQHKRSPYRATFLPIIKLDIPNDLREALLDVALYEKRVVGSVLLKARPTHIRIR